MMMSTSPPQLQTVSESEQLHVEELQDIITSTPKWLIRNGISVFFLVILSIVIGSIFIEYPDVTNSSLVVRRNSESASIIAAEPGRLVEVLVAPDQLVRTGQDLAYLANPADHQQMLALIKDLEIIQEYLITGKKFPEDIFKEINIAKLGDLSPVYQGFYLSYMANNSFLKHKDWQRLSVFIQDLNKASTATKEWKRKYVLVSPVNGSIKFNERVNLHQRINAGEELFYVDAGGGDFFGEISLTKDELKKAKIGQKVVVKIKSLPTDKFGILEGHIKGISNYPLNNGSYVLTVVFKPDRKRLINSSNLRPGMLADAEVITQNISLFSRITDGIFHDLNNVI